VSWQDKSPEKAIEMSITNRFWRAVIKRIGEGSGDRSGIHVTDLVYSCLRRAYYDKTLGEAAGAVSDNEGMMVVWIGQMLHGMPIDPDKCEHEKKVEIELDGVKVEGRVDELCRIGDSYIVVDKKSTRNIPNNPHDHHIKQVLFYSAILTKKYGYRVSHAGILYLDVANLKVKFFVIPITAQMVDTALREVEAKAKILQNAITHKTAPAPDPGWLCSYCPYFKRCVLDGWGPDQETNKRDLAQIKKAGGSDG
jgi:CRISPR/Cas system-associated exonuclease Cas4 (RecB family)